MNTLAIVYGKPVQETAEDLLVALQEELVLPVDESYKYISAPLQSPASERISNHVDLFPVYRFLHDRVQQAAYSLIEETKRPEVHLKIGREMLKRISEEELEEHIFGIVDQLNLSSELIADEKEREKLAQFNLLAGKKAKLSAAYEPAFDYLKSGIRMLKENSWQVQYGLTLSLHEEGAEAAYLCGDYEKMGDLVETVLHQAKTVLDKIKTYDVKIQACAAQHKLLDAVKTGLHVLRLLGVRFPQNQKKMKKWAYHAPMNYLHKWQLVEAERAKVLGKEEKAIAFYNQAIAGAKENQYIQEEALANELAAKFYLEKGETETARKYMKEARYCYDHWGAKAKVDHLDQNYPELLADVSAKTSQASNHDKDRKPGHSATTITTTTNQLKGEQLDLTSVMKASQVISGEIQIEKLLSRMMQIIIENAGAEKGCLIL